jgi:hypothetical protein
MRLNCPVDDALDAARTIETWLESVGAGEYDGDEMLSELGKAIEALETQRHAVRKALG